MIEVPKPQGESIFCFNFSGCQRNMHREKPSWCFVFDKEWQAERTQSREHLIRKLFRLVQTYPNLANLYFYFCIKSEITIISKHVRCPLCVFSSKNAHEPDVLLSNQLFDWWNIYPLLQVTITQSSIDVNLHDETVL
jgi:hypothetical protein